MIRRAALFIALLAWLPALIAHGERKGGDEVMTGIVRSDATDPPPPLSTSGREVFRIDADLRASHVAAALDYVASGAYLTQPEFQRFVETRASERRPRANGLTSAPP